MAPPRNYKIWSAFSYNFKSALTELDALKDVDVRTVEKEGLVDIRKVEIDRSLSLEERKRAYLEAVGNPYAVRVGDMKVRVRFAEDGGSFEEAFENMLRNV